MPRSRPWSRLRCLLGDLVARPVLVGLRDITAQLLLAGLQLLDRLLQRRDFARHRFNRLRNFGRKRCLGRRSLCRRRGRSRRSRSWRWRRGCGVAALLRRCRVDSRLRRSGLGIRVLRLGGVGALRWSRRLCKQLRHKRRKPLLRLVAIGMPGHRCGNAGADGQQDDDATTGPRARCRNADVADVVVQRRGTERRLVRRLRRRRSRDVWLRRRRRDSDESCARRGARSRSCAAMASCGSACGNCIGAP